MKYVFLDFNGTIINDIDLCLDLLNEILIKQGKETITKERYKNIFTFPIKKYYELAGVDFNQDSFEVLAKWFIAKYQPLSMQCGLFPNIVEAFAKLKELGYRLVILSASEKNNLLEQCHNYDIIKYFDAILGIDNIHADGKVHIALDYIQEHNIDPNDVTFIGDTLHDLEVAKAIGCKCVLVSCGHQSYEVLSTSGQMIVDDVYSYAQKLDKIMHKVIEEDFKNLELGEFPYDKAHSALGEYHCLRYPGSYGKWYDPICSHQWRSLDGSWLVVSDGNKRFLEQNRGDNSHGAFANVFCCLVHEQALFANYTLEFKMRILELNNYCGMAFNYLTSRCYDFIGIKGNLLSLYHRNEDEITIYQSKEIVFDDLKTYKIKLVFKGLLEVYLDEEFIFSADLRVIEGSKIAFCAKSCCRYSDLTLTMDAEEYKKHLALEKKVSDSLKTKQKQYASLECIKKIDLKNFGSGRQLRIVVVDNRPIFLIAQHQKRMFRDAFARLSCLTCFDYEGNILWQKGEPNNSFEQTMISCDLPFQIADLNNDGKLEVIYSQDFEIIICDLLTGNEIKRMPTPIVYNDKLVKNHPYYRLNVDAIRMADFSGKGYKSDFIIKDRYQNVWAFNDKFENIWRYNHKNTGHFPYIYDFDGDGKDEMFVGYDLIDHDGKMLFSLPMDSDHTDEIIYVKLHENEPKRLILASGNEGVNIVNIDGSIYKHNEIGHAQRICAAKLCQDLEGLQIMATSFWGADGIIAIYDWQGNLLKKIEQRSNGNIITPLNYDGKNILAILNASEDGGLIDGNLDKVVKFPIDGHPTLAIEVYDLDNDGIDEIICFDQKQMWIYKASEFVKNNKRYLKYPDNSFSNYRGEYLIEENFND